jgi:hypothetical protein
MLASWLGRVYANSTTGVLDSTLYSVTDLSEPSWLATPENIEYAAESITSQAIEPGYTLIMEMFGNSTFRYTQFDGTMALPFKADGGYHMGGDIGTCDDASFIRTLTATSRLFDDDNAGIKIFIPPLPQHLFGGCCDTASHSTNVGTEGYTTRLLQETMRFRGILKNELLKRGEENFFVLDGVGGVLGFAPGGNRPPLGEIIADLEAVFKNDNVHFTDVGYRYLSNTIIAAIEGVHDGTLTKSKLSSSEISGAGGGESSPHNSKKNSFFWRGFSSPVGVAQTLSASLGRGGNGGDGGLSSFGGSSTRGGPGKWSASGKPVRGRHYDWYQGPHRGYHGRHGGGPRGGGGYARRGGSHRNPYY